MANQQNKYLLFYKSKDKAIKSTLGALFNLASRVVSGVIAGIIITNIQPNIQNNTPITPEQGAAVTGAIMN